MCQLGNFQSRPQDAHPRDRVEGGYHIISLKMLVAGGYVQNNLPSPLPLDEHLMALVESFQVCTECLVCT
jgi:hypothetical protein